ncbi:MAG: metallophosphoesterase [Bryobacterales bacterium]|nr:metallophosphoesterase [Bryobacterales bacterium]
MTGRRTFIKGLPATALLATNLPFAFAAEERLRFCLMGDRTGGADANVYERSVERIVAEKPEFVINVGDSIEGYEDFWTDVQWVDLKPVWRAYGKTPHYFTPGNHDVWSPDSARLYKRFTGFDLQYSFTHRHCHITVLDNSRHDTLAKDQLLFLEDDLKKHKDIPCKLVFLHKPFWVIFVKLQSSEFELHRICRKYGVQWVMSGHVHHLWHMQRDGIRYVAIGSSGASMERGRQLGRGWDSGWFYHYGVMEVAATSMQLSIKELPRPDGQGRAFPIEQWQDNHPAPGARIGMSR